MVMVPVATLQVGCAVTLAVGAAGGVLTEIVVLAVPVNPLPSVTVTV